MGAANTNPYLVESRWEIMFLFVGRKPSTLSSKKHSSSMKSLKFKMFTPGNCPSWRRNDVFRADHFGVDPDRKWTSSRRLLALHVDRKLPQKRSRAQGGAVQGLQGAADPGTEHHCPQVAYCLDKSEARLTCIKL